MLRSKTGGHSKVKQTSNGHSAGQPNWYFIVYSKRHFFDQRVSNEPYNVDRRLGG